MITKNRKKRNSAFQNILVAVIFLFIFGGGIGFMSYQNIKINQKRGELEEKLQSLQAQTEQLSVRKTELEKQIGEIESEEYQEKLLREQGLYKKEGEEVKSTCPGVSIKFKITPFQCNRIGCTLMVMPRSRSTSI